MNSKILSHLDANEIIIHKGSLHWFLVWRQLIVCLFFMILACVICVAYITYNYEYYLYLGFTFITCGIISYICGYIIRMKTEYVITSSRLIQKEGIFDIKITEIPLFKVETVNFYQSFWQRLLNTGVIELVGSGGTSHVIRYLQDPNKVRNVIMSSINSKTSKND